MDVGGEFLDRLYGKLMIDDQWAERRERGFSWWGYRLAQHVEVDLPVSDGELNVCAVRIWTDVVRDVDPQTKPAAILALINTHQTMNAVTWDPSTGAIRECCTAFVHEQNIGWLTNLLATSAVLQNTAAHSRAHGLAEVCGGTPDAADHPSSGQRTEMDDLLNLPEHVIAPAGAEVSRFAGAMINGLPTFLTHNAIGGQASDTELRCAVPFTDHHTYLAMVAGGEHPPMSHIQMLADAPHPEFGNGALVLLQTPPVAVPQRDPGEVANALNLAEAQGYSQVPLLGAWCPSPTAGDGVSVAFCSFLPNAIAQPGLLENQVIYQRNRSTFASHWFSAQVAG